MLTINYSDNMLYHCPTRWIEPLTFWIHTTVLQGMVFCVSSQDHLKWVMTITENYQKRIETQLLKTNPNPIHNPNPEPYKNA